MPLCMQLCSGSIRSITTTITIAIAIAIAFNDKIKLHQIKQLDDVIYWVDVHFQ